MQKLTEIVIASHNKGKVKEIGELIAPLGIRVLSAAETGVNEPEEDGLTFAENASLKARNAVARSGKASLSDDSGLVIPALAGAPGIFSARWTGENKDYSLAFARIQKELAEKNIANADGTPAYFVCALCLALPGGEQHVFEGRVDGTLTFPPRGDSGFGYDPIFTPEDFNITFGEMASAKKHSMSHRARAFDKLLKFLESNV